MSPRRPGDPVSSLHGGQINAILVSVLGILAGLVLVALSLLIALVLLRRYVKWTNAKTILDKSQTSRIIKLADDRRVKLKLSGAHKGQTKLG